MDEQQLKILSYSMEQSLLSYEKILLVLIVIIALVMTISPIMIFFNIKIFLTLQKLCAMNNIITGMTIKKYLNQSNKNHVLIDKDDDYSDKCKNKDN